MGIDNMMKDEFKEFDNHMCSLIGTPLLAAAIKAQSNEISIRAIGMGVEVTVSQLEELKQRNADFNAIVHSREGNESLAHIFARKRWVYQLKYIIDSGAEIDIK